MKIEFYKYQGTGNDFVILDNRTKLYSKVPVKELCDRRFGIGADGLMLLETLTGYDFKMVYYNSDGNESSMCGNGGRCLAAFAHKLGIGKEKKLHFLAIDGEHEAIILDKENVSLKMGDVSAIKKVDSDFELNTGSPHYVQFVQNTKEVDILPMARQIRNSDVYLKKGINVNFVTILNSNEIDVRTYERGVEDETYSCGTGVTACAIALSEKSGFEDGKHEVDIHTPGGNLKVSFIRKGNSYSDIWLTGPAIEVFSGIKHI